MLDKQVLVRMTEKQHAALKDIARGRGSFISTVAREAMVKYLNLPLDGERPTNGEEK